MSFKCPYVNTELTKPCEVDSCNFNLSDSDMGRMYKRCYLNYQEALRYNPFTTKMKEVQYNSLSVEQRERVVFSFFKVTKEDVDRSNSVFYTNLFGVLAEDAAAALTKKRLDPVPFKQCAVCGIAEDKLFLPEESALPSGFGYCSYKCFQMKPPPVLLLEKNLELDFLDFIKALEKETSQSRVKLVSQVIEHIFSNNSMV